MATMRSLVNDLVMLVARGDKFTLIDDIGSAYIADCRGAIASNFLKTDSDCLVFVDSDVAWEKGALLRLVDHPVDLVDRKSTRLNSSHVSESRMPSSA